MIEKVACRSAVWARSGSALALLWLAACGSTVDAGAAKSAGGAAASLAGGAVGKSDGGQTGVPVGGSGGASAGTGGAISSAATAGSAGAALTNGGATANTTGGTATANGGAGATVNGGAANAAGAANTGGGTAHAGSGGTNAGCSGIFCEDFESGSLNPAVWDSQTSGGQTVTVQSALTAHGKYAAQFHAKPNIQSYDFIITKNAPATLRGHHFGRAYFNVTPKPPAEHTGFLFAGTPGFPKLKYLEVAGIGTAWQLTYVDLIGGGESYASGGTAPDARWVCLEWEFNDTPDQVTVFVDGVQSYARPSITFMNQSTGLVGGFSDFGFGYYAWHPATYAFDIYYDDIVLDTKRVGCLGP
jgi:hypothetical protein